MSARALLSDGIDGFAPALLVAPTAKGSIQTLLTWRSFSKTIQPGMRERWQPGGLFACFSGSRGGDCSQTGSMQSTVFYAAVFAIGYYMMIRGNREVLQEMREERLSGGRPQAIVETSLLNLPLVECVVPHVSGGSREGYNLRNIEAHRRFVGLSHLGIALSQGRHTAARTGRENTLPLGPCRSSHARLTRSRTLRRHFGENRLQRPYRGSLHNRVEDQPPAIRRVALRCKPAFPRVIDCTAREQSFRGRRNRQNASSVEGEQGRLSIPRFQDRIRPQASWHLEAPLCGMFLPQSGLLTTSVLGSSLLSVVRRGKDVRPSRRG